jgi:isoamylase
MSSDHPPPYVLVRARNRPRLGERGAGRDEGETNERGVADIAWHGTRLGSAGFDDPQGRALACTIAGFEGGADRHVMMNMFREPLEFEVPVDPQRTWHLVVDNVAGASCGVQARSIVILAGTFS